MSAHLRCARCGRQSYRDLNVHLSDDGVPLCDGEDCEQVAAGFHVAEAARRSGYKGLFAAALLAAEGTPMSAQRHIARQGSRAPETPSQNTPADTMPEHIIPNRIRRAAEKRARRAARRRQS